jgi:hypothetical protein
MGKHLILPLEKKKGNYLNERILVLGDFPRGLRSPGQRAHGDRAWRVRLNRLKHLSVCKYCIFPFRTQRELSSPPPNRYAVANPPWPRQI